MSIIQTDRPKYLPQLTGLRFFAAFAVILCHFSTYIFPHQPELLAKFNNGLYNAVSLFFVLSGFILAHTYGSQIIEKQVTIRKYLVARIARIYPVFLLGLAIDLPVFIVNNRHDFTSSTKYLMILKVFLLQTWLPMPEVATNRWNAPSWSLSTEFFFYLVFPFVIGWFFRLDKVLSKVVLILTLAMTTILAVYFDLYYSVKIPPDNPNAGLVFLNFLGTNPLVRVLEFFAGIALYNIYRYYATQLQAKPKALWTTVLIFAASVYAWVNIVGTPVIVGQGICTFFFAFLILGLSLDLFNFSDFMKHKKLVLLGESSYSLYLIHLPIFHTAFLICRKVPILERFKVDYPIICGLMLVGVCVAASILCYRLVEKPGRVAILDKYSKA